MLGKLLKHEFRATARIMLPLFASLTVLSVLGNISTRVLDATDVTLLRILGTLIIVAFILGVVVVGVMSVILMVKRFHNNLLTHEGYLMFTLPTSVHSLVWSKMIVSVTWFVGTALVVLLSVFIVTFRVEYMNNILEGLQEAFQRLNMEYSLNYAAIVLETVIMVFLGGTALCLLFYASMSVGYGFARRKVLLSVVFFFLFQFVMQFVSTSAITIFGNALELPLASMAPMSIWHTVSLSGIAGELIYCAIFYFITTISLKNRLNLE